MIMTNILKSYVGIHIFEFIYEFMPFNYDYEIVYEFMCEFSAMKNIVKSWLNSCK